ncbi:cytochrome c [bacterium]|nr:cytochrome c [candidate division CSSED10-310 bacterium]
MRTIWTVLSFSLGIALIVCAAFSNRCIYRARPLIQPRSVYIETCATCHSPDGPASNLQPQTLTRDEWRDFFDNGVHTGERLTDFVDDGDLKIIETYCIENARPSSE